MVSDNRARLKEWLQSGEIRLEPLSFPQRELWEASPVPAVDVSNNICAMIHVRGHLTPQGSEAALQKVVDRQEVFRLSFLPGKDQAMVMIRKTGKPALCFHNLPVSQHSTEAIEELAKAIFIKPFDLVQGPLYRAEVFSRSADDHVLVLAIHHSIADGWTLGVFVQDLFAAYMQGVLGIHKPLPPVPQSYTEWAKAERATWHPAEMAKRTLFWKRHLAGPTRLWNKGCGEHPIDRHVTQVSAEQGRALRELARRHGATLFSTLLAAFQITLSKWTGSDDIVVGTPVANRNKQLVREAMGYCSGIVPIRGFIDRTRTFADSLQATHLTTLECFANAMPFVEIMRATGEVSSPGRNPLFEVRFALQNHPVPDVAVPGLSLKLRMRSTGTSRFALACEINEEGEALEVAWLARPDLITPLQIDEVGQLYLAVIARICHTPEVLTSVLIGAVT